MGDFEGSGGENTTKSAPGSSHPAGSAMDAFFAAANQHAPVPVDPRVPGKKPDHTGAWPDEKDHLVSTDAQKIAEAHALAEASVLAISLKQDTRDAKYRAVDTLDRVADPEMRKRMMVHYERITDEKLDASIEKSASFDKRDKEQALDLISTQRDAAYTKLAGLPPAEKASLEKNAETWASQVLAVTRPDDADEDGNARKIVNVLGPLEPYQIEAVRAAVRAQTGGKSIYQELDRSLSGSEGDAAVAALKGDPVFSGTIALTTANGDLETVRDTLGWMSGEQIAEMKARGAKVGLDTDWIANSVPENHRAEVQALVDAKGTKANKNAAAEGERIAELFSDPREGLSISSIHDKQKLRDLETHAAPNILSELLDKSPEEIQAARATWEKAHPGESWGALAERFRDGDANTYLRMQALMNGDKVGERAYALREAMRTHDQAGIEAALASPDLDNENDPMKKALAHAERLALMGRMRDLDARDRQLTAPLTGQSGGRTLDQQLADSYADYVESEPDVDQIDSPDDAIDIVANYKDKDERRQKARNDQIATKQMLETGELAMATKIHRAREAGDVKGESKLMQSIGTNDELRDVRLDYLATYDERMFRGLETDRFKYVAGVIGDDDDGEMSKRIALEAESTEELRMRQIGERGVLAERSVKDQVADQQAISDKTESDSLEFSEQLRVWRGGNYGTQDLMRAGNDRVARMVDAQTGELREGVSKEQLARANETLVASQELQGAEKQKHADEAAAMVGTMIRLGALFVPGAYPLLNLAANLSGMAIKGEIEGADYKHRQNADWVNTGASLAADLVGMGAGKLATAGKISQGVAMGASTGAQIVAAVASSTAAGDTSEQTGGTALNVALGSFLPFLGSAAGSVIRGSSPLARVGRGLVDTGVQAGGSYGLNGGQGGLVDVIDAVGGAAGDHLSGGGPHPRRRTPTAKDHRNASGHYAEDDGPNVRHRGDDSTAPTVRRVDDADKGHNTENHPVRDPARQAAAEQPAGTRHSDDEADLRKGDGDQTNATTRRRAELSARMAPDERTQREEYFREHGHTGTDLHSHFMGVTTVDDFAKEMGRKQGAPISREEMLDKMVSAVREDSDYAKHYSINEAGEQVFDHTGGGIDPKQGGHAFDNVKTIEAGKAKIDELRKQPPTPETDAEIRRIAAETIDNAMNSSQHTPYDGAYSIRDTMVKAYIDPQVKGEPTKPYANFTRMTLEALARDGVLYSEQSQSVKKLGAGNVPYDVVRDEMNRFNADRATRGEPPVDLRFLAMIETRFLGAEGSESAGTEADWKKQLDGARAMVKRGDVMGVDFASPETSDMAKGGKQLEQRFEQLAIMLAEEGKEAGRKLTLRPHVGEGYIEMPNDPSTGTRAGFDRDHSDAHYGKARSNLDALIANVERLTTVRGADGKPIYDPENPAFEIRFGHATHATPEQAEAMARLGIKVEVNLGSNAISGSLQDSKTTPQGRSPDGHLHSMDDHSLLALAGAGAEVHLSTDAQSVMRTRLREEYKRAAGVLADFRGDPTQGIDPRGTMPVTRETFLAARPDVDATTARPPYQLAYGELPDGVKRNIDEAYDRMVEDSMQRQSQVDADDVHDRRRGETR